LSELPAQCLFLLNNLQTGENGKICMAHSITVEDSHIKP